MLCKKKFAITVTLCLSLVLVEACSDDSSSEAPLDTETTTQTVNQDDPIDPSTSDETASFQSQLQSVVDTAVESGVPGVSLHVQQGGISTSVVAGNANRDTAEPITTDSLFPIASVGKMYMGTMFMRFVDMGMLQLDDPIAQWLDPAISEMVTNSDTITVEMLLSHTSGIPEYLIGEYIVDLAAAPGKIWTPIEVIGYIKDEDNLFQPGEAYQYSNTNFVLLGAMAETVTGGPLSAALRLWVFEPGGLEHTYHPHEDLGQPDPVHVYVPASFSEDESTSLDLGRPVDGPDLDTFEYIDSVALGAAPVVSTPGDMNLFIRTLIDTDRLVSEESKAKMLTEAFPGSGYGLGVMVALDDPVNYGHDGYFSGYQSYLLYIPSQDLSFATTVNGSVGTYDEIFDQYITQLISVLLRSLQNQSE